MNTFPRIIGRRGLRGMIAGALLAFTLLVPTTQGQEPAPEHSSSSSSAITTPLCDAAMQTRLTEQQQILRQIWFGRDPAASESVNAVRMDEDGRNWIKVSDGEWANAVNASESDTKTDADIDATTVWEGMNESQPDGGQASRTGIFMQKEMFASQEVPELAQSMRAFDCRLAMVCESEVESYEKALTDANGLLEITTPGCDTLVTPPIAECAFDNADPQQNEANLNTNAGFEQNMIYTQCDTLATQLFDREAAFLRVAVAYHAAETTALQLSGMESAVMRGLRGDFLAPLEQTLPLLSTFSRLPCFANQCNL